MQVRSNINAGRERICNTAVKDVTLSLLTCSVSRSWTIETADRKTSEDKIEVDQESRVIVYTGPLSEH